MNEYCSPYPIVVHTVHGMLYYFTEGYTTHSHTRSCTVQYVLVVKITSKWQCDTQYIRVTTHAHTTVLQFILCVAPGLSVSLHSQCTVSFQMLMVMLVGRRLCFIKPSTQNSRRYVCHNSLPHTHTHTHTHARTHTHTHTHASLCHNHLL